MTALTLGLIDARYTIAKMSPMMPVRNQNTTIKAIHNAFDELAAAKAAEGREAASTKAQMQMTRCASIAMSATETKMNVPVPAISSLVPATLAPQFGSTVTSVAPCP
jgi:hypothetical protein